MRFMYFTYMSENRTTKLVKIVLSRGEGAWENNGEDESKQRTLDTYGKVTMKLPCTTNKNVKKQEKIHSCSKFCGNFNITSD
jgi:hypothetical protein